MVQKIADKKADIEVTPDRGEAVSLMEPMRIGESSSHRSALADQALELAQKSTAFRSSLPQPREPPSLAG